MAQRIPTQSRISPSILVYEYTSILRDIVYEEKWSRYPGNAWLLVPRGLVSASFSFLLCFSHALKYSGPKVCRLWGVPASVQQVLTPTVGQSPFHVKRVTNLIEKSIYEDYSGPTKIACTPGFD